MRIVLLKDLTDKVGRKYSKEDFVNFTECYGTFSYVMYELPKEPSKIDLEKLSHKITNISIENNNLVGEIEFLDTPLGKIAKELKEHVTLYTSIRAVGEVDTNMDVSNAVVFGFDLIGLAQ
jgi:hypothetical protein